MIRSLFRVRGRFEIESHPRIHRTLSRTSQFFNNFLHPAIPGPEPLGCFYTGEWETEEQFDRLSPRHYESRSLSFVHPFPFSACSRSSPQIPAPTAMKRKASRSCPTCFLPHKTTQDVPSKTTSQNHGNPFRISFTALSWMKDNSHRSSI